MPSKKTKGKKKVKELKKDNNQVIEWYNKKYSTVDALKYLFEKSKYFASLINSEVYKYDKAPSPFVTTITGYADTVVDISMGDQDAQRTGNSVLIKAVKVSGLIRQSTTTPNPASYNRFLLCLDKQEVSDLTYPPISDVLENTSDSSIIRSPLNSNTVGRFKILVDKVFALDTYHPQKTFNFYIPIGKHCRYNGIGSTDIQKGNIFWYMIADVVNGTGGLTNPVVDMQSRTYFHDN